MVQKLKGMSITFKNIVVTRVSSRQDLWSRRFFTSQRPHENTTNPTKLNREFCNDRTWAQCCLTSGLAVVYTAPITGVKNW